MISAFLLPLCLCAGKAGMPPRCLSAAPEDSLALMRVLSASVSPGELAARDAWDVLYGDLDGDGHHELLAGTTSFGEDEVSEPLSAAYLVMDDGVVVLDSLHPSSCASRVEAYSIAEGSVILSHRSLADGLQSYSVNYLLSNGILRKLGRTPSLIRDYIGLGFEVRGLDAGGVASTSEQIYYVYFDGQDLVEFEGDPISSHEFTFFVGGMEIMTGIMQGYVRVGDIFYRANGTVDVNYYKETGSGRECFYSTYQILGGVPYIVYDALGEIQHPGTKLRVSGLIP